ncbi:MAG TPA: class I tRNA ligase family protein [Candidatus Nitrosocosmicus sp.]|nr:class I tRNA ligase family protein [Candidatus Nitrosocosmicus sp.]
MKIFICGPTLYEKCHIGHARIFVFFNFLINFHKFMGHSPLALMQLTDIDPKIYQKNVSDNDRIFDITNILFTNLIDDINSLQVANNFIFTRVSDFIQVIEKDVVNILFSSDGYSYAGNVYLNVFNNIDSPFGLSYDDINDMPIDISKGKHNQTDIILWNSENFYPRGIIKDICKSENHRTLTSGIPGWHFQDYEIIRYVFEGICDIHGGARELLYPHHEFIDEISKNFDKKNNKLLHHKAWIHVGLVNVRGEKMSNSTGNTILISDILKKYNPNVLKIFFLSYHYKNDIEFKIKDLDNCDKIDKYITMNIFQEKDLTEQNNYNEKQLRIKFMNLLTDDYNTGSVIKLIIELLETNRNSSLIRWMLEILGLRYY